MLPTLYDWSVEHIRRVFEAKSEDECLRALDDTFARDGDFASNGRTLGRRDLQRFVLAMVSASGFRLKVQWMNALEVPTDDSNRVRPCLPHPTLFPLFPPLTSKTHRTACSADTTSSTTRARCPRAAYPSQDASRATSSSTSCESPVVRVRARRHIRCGVGSAGPGSSADTLLLPCRIESMADDPAEDSRRIVKLNITASDKPM